MHWFYIKCGLIPHIYFLIPLWRLVSHSFSLSFSLYFLIIYVFIFGGKAKASAESRPLWQMRTSASSRFVPEDAEAPPSDPDEDEEEELQLQIS